MCDRSARPERIPAITEPQFAPDYAKLPYVSLRESIPVIGITRSGEARAHPAIATNQLVNDTFDVPVVLTYCPPCSSGLTTIRRVEGEATTFGNTSRTWRPPDVSAERVLQDGTVFGNHHGKDPAATRPTTDPNLVMIDVATGSYSRRPFADHGPG